MINRACEQFNENSEQLPKKNDNYDNIDNYEKNENVPIQVENAQKSQTQSEELKNGE